MHMLATNPVLSDAIDVFVENVLRIARAVTNAVLRLQTWNGTDYTI